MRQSLSVPPCLIGLLVILTMGLMSFTGGERIEAQEFPPFPTLYGGHVWVNDEPAQIGTVLVARVGDYQTSTVVDEEGLYRNLLVQPQSSDYYGQTVTFHARGTAAQEQDEFPRVSGPVFKTTFDLHFLLSETAPLPPPPVQATHTLVVDPGGRSGQRSVLLIALLAVLGVVVAAAVLVSLGRRYRRQ